MQLLTKAVRTSLPPLGSQSESSDPVIHAKFFTPDAGWTWYATEGSPEGADFIFFGYVIGVEPEWGTFSLKELESVRGVLGLPVERDRYFKPAPFSQVVKQQLTSS